MSNRWKDSDNFIADVRYKGDEFTIVHAQDVEPYLKAAHAQRMGNFKDTRGYTDSGNMRKIASIPDLEYTRWLKEDPDLAQDMNKLVRKLKAYKEKGLDYTTVDRI